MHNALIEFKSINILAEIACIIIGFKICLSDWQSGNRGRSCRDFEAASVGCFGRSLYRVFEGALSINLGKRARKSYRAADFQQTCRSEISGCN